MDIRIALVSFGLFALTACHNKGDVQNSEMEKPTIVQQKLLDAGWTAAAPNEELTEEYGICLLYTSPSPRDRQKSRMPSSA